MQPRAVLDDPEMNAQWHLINTGQNGGTVGEDANVTAAWDIADGTGVQISIIDDGFAHSHTDLSWSTRVQILTTIAAMMVTQLHHLIMVMVNQQQELLEDAGTIPMVLLESPIIPI